MGMTKNYRFVKKHCTVCGGSGKVEIPKSCNDALDYFMYAKDYNLANCETIEETCPICDGKGWYYYEFED
jgi:rRNA maturation protein Nop10